jgi:hypothetical protein
MNIDIHSATEQILHTWENGGWVMAALACLALISYTTATRLLLFLYHRGLTKACDKDIRAWVADPSRAPRQLREL